MADETPNTTSLDHAIDLTIAWLSNPNTRASTDEVVEVLGKMHTAVASLTAGSAEAPQEASEEFTPAVSVRRSLASKDHLISLIDGKPYKTLRRHLAGHGLTPDQYRERYNLRPDYPMVSESYSQVRREMAKKLGLGRKPGDTAAKRSARKTAPAASGTAAKRAASKAAPETE